MDTRELIEELAAHAKRQPISLEAVWRWLVVSAFALAALMFLVLIGPRPDIAVAAETPRFLLKFAVTITLSASAFSVIRELSRPGETWRRALPCLLAAPALIVAGVTAELASVPAELWSARLIGANGLACLTYISLIGLGPLGLLLLAVRHGASTKPGLAGAVAGLLAGGIAATFYAAHCTDDSPLFVATWYTMAVGLLAVTGSAAARRFCRW